MAVPTLSPSQATSAVTLPSTGSTSNVDSTAVPFGIYLNGDGAASFTQGASDQVAYTYKKLRFKFKACLTDKRIIKIGLIHLAILYHKLIPVKIMD